MKTLQKTIFMGILLAVAVFSAPMAEAQYIGPYTYTPVGSAVPKNNAAQIQQLQALLNQLIQMLNSMQTQYSGTPVQNNNGIFDSGPYYSNNSYNNYNNFNNNNRPDVDTGDVDDIEDDSVEFEGDVDMNGFTNGLVFLVYGEDEDDIEDVENEEEYADVDEEGDDLQKIIVERRFYGEDDFSEDVSGLDRDTRYYYRYCVEYVDTNGEDDLECGNVEDFDTDR